MPYREEEMEGYLYFGANIRKHGLLGFVKMHFSYLAEDWAHSLCCTQQVALLRLDKPRDLKYGSCQTGQYSQL